MIVKCPNCEHEFDLELETHVVEMLFACPDCKTTFKVGNTDNNPPRKAVEHRPEPVQQQAAAAVQPQEGEKKEPNNWMTKLLRLLVVLMLISTMCVICGWGLYEFIMLGVIGILGYISILIVNRKPKTEEKEGDDNWCWKFLVKFTFVLPVMLFMVLLSFKMIDPKYVNWQSNVVIGLITSLVIFIFCKTKKRLLAFVLCVIFAFIIASIYDYYKNKEAMAEVSRYLNRTVPASEEEEEEVVEEMEVEVEVTVPATKTETIKASEGDTYTQIYKHGYKIGYTIDDETYRLCGGEGYIRSLWGLAATYEMLHNEALYKEFRRGILDGMAKRRNDTRAERAY
ncbi:MAG: hypothetical protein J1E37_08685 [Prevotella sp.]|nr:hypothetical protein [Prevotella sp.]